MKVRLKDVAQRAGVAVNTASMILNRRPNCWASKQTGERVFKAAAELRYKPSRTAVALRLGKFHTVGLLVPDLQNPHWALFAQLLQIEMQKHGYDLMIESSHSSRERELQCLENILDRQVDGLVACLIDQQPHRQWLEAHFGASKPVVALTEAAQCMPGFDHIALDGSTGVAEALNHLEANGHTDAVVLQDVEKQLPHGNIQLRYVKCACTLEGAYEAAAQILAAGEKPSAILAHNDLTALAVARAAADAGLELPSELSIVSLESSPIGKFLPVTLTSVQLPIEQMIGITTTLMLKRLKDPKPTQAESHYVASTLGVGESTNPSLKPAFA